MQRRLQRCKEILLKIAERPDCTDITGYGKSSIELFVWGIDSAIKRYKSEAVRVRKLQHAQNY